MLRGPNGFAARRRSKLESLVRQLAPLAARRVTVALLLAFVLAMVLIQAQLRVFTIDETIDSYSYYFAAKALAAGLDPYDLQVVQDLASPELGFIFPYLYPPILAMVWRPLTLVTPEIAHQIVVVGGACLAVFNLGILWRLIRPIRNPGGWFVLFVLFHAVCGPLVSSVRLGQVNTLLATLVFGALLFERDDEPALAGFLLALAIVIKVTPLVFLVDLIVRGRWRSLAATFFFVVGLAVGSALWIGIGPWAAFVRTAAEPFPFTPVMSLNGLTTAAAQALQVPRAVTILVFFAALTVLVTRLAVRLPRLSAAYGRSDDPASVAGEFARGAVPAWGMLTLFSLLAFPLTWHHHYYLALLPFGFFTLRAFDEGRTGRAWVWLALGLLVLLRYPGVLHPAKPLASLAAIFLI